MRGGYEDEGYYNLEEGAGPIDEELVNNPHHRQDISYIDKSAIKGFSEVSFYSFQNYNRFHVFFEESKLSEEKIKEIDILISCLTKDMQDLSLYAIYDETSNKYKVYNSQDNMTFFMVLSEDNKLMDWYGLDMVKKFEFHEMDGTIEGIETGVRLFGIYSTKSNEQIELDMEFNGENSEPTMTLSYPKSIYGEKFKMEDTEDSRVLKVLNPTSNQVIYELRFIEDKTGEIELKDIKTQKIINATYNFKK